jgi:hypothetical protein
VSPPTSPSLGRVDVSSLEVFDREDRAWFRCRPRLEAGGCEEQEVDGTDVLYRWSPGMEEEGGSYSWQVARDNEVVRVAYEASGLFDADPRGLDLRIDPRGPAGRGARSGDEPAHHPRGVHRRDRARPLRRCRGEARDAVLTTVGRVRQIDPLPCPVQRQRTTRDGCFAWTEDSATTWTSATSDEPGRQWVIGAQDDDTFNRVESVGTLITSDAIDSNPFDDSTDPGEPRLPETLMADLEGMTADLRIGPERRRQ